MMGFLRCFEQEVQSAEVPNSPEICLAGPSHGDFLLQASFVVALGDK
jgi:hypothetical protein